jgi:glutamate-1-semialdehyde 2,1-aminomutase
VPSAEKTLLCVSGSEATFNAIRLARAVTGRSDLIKFEGCYHGWHDDLLMNHYMTKGSKLGDRTPPSAGILQEALEHTHIVNFNRIDEVEAKIREKRGKIAAVIVEPIMHNVGSIMPKPGFLEELRELTERHGIILIFDEIITGFRHGLGGYQEKCGVTPDVTTLGKSIANGFPMAAICGREDLMDRFSTAGGDVFYLGTFNAHPVSTAASLATIEELEDGSVYEKIFRLGDRIRKGLQEISVQLGLKTYASGYGSVFVNYFMEPPVESYPDLLRNNTQSDLSFRRMMIERGILLSSRNIRRSVISASHSDMDIDTTLEKARESLIESSKLK